MRLARTAPALLAALLASACSGEPLPPPVVAHTAEPPPRPAPPLTPARWIEGGGATLVGPSVGDATLVLLGGRRALVGKDGAVKSERVPCPEPLIELVEVPAAGGSRLVGRGLFGVYRFDDPLGAPRVLGHSDAPLALLGAAPGIVAYWTAHSDLPRFLDVETGAAATLAGLPEPPLRAIAYVDDKRGAAVFEAAGLATTSDGGASWKVASDTGNGEALRAGGLRRKGGSLRAFAFPEGLDAAIDLSAGRLGPLEQQHPSGEEPRLLRWIRAVARDPLEAVASAGIDLQSNGALVASHGQLARVDPASGALLDLSEFARGKDMSACVTARAGDAAWIACYLSDGQGGANLFDPYGVLRVPLAQSPLDAGRPALIRNGEAEMRSSPSGAALLLGSCSTESEGEACVVQPDGKWATFHSDVDLGPRGTGPLADGRIAIVRGLFDGDEAAEAEPSDRAVAAPLAVAGDEERAGRPYRIHVALRDAAGKEQALPPITLSGSRDALRIQSPIEEAADHSLHFVIDTSEGLFSVVQSPARESASVQSIPGAFAARIHAGRGIAVGEAHALASLDGGLSWGEIPAPARLFREIDDRSYAVDDPAFLMVSEMGAKIGTHLRLGWGPSAGRPDEPAAEGPLLATPHPRDKGPDRLLSCKSEGAAQSSPPLLGLAQVRTLLASKPQAQGKRRETSAWANGHASMLSTLALLEEDGPERPGSPPPSSAPPTAITRNSPPRADPAAPTSWTLRWHDPTEIGGKPRSCSAPVPADTSWGTSLRFAASSGGRALFVLSRTRSSTPLLVRALAGGKAELRPVSWELAPSGDVVFATDKSETIAWLHDATLVVWNPGEPPRAVASLATHAVRTLGQPTRDGVPVLLGSSDWSMIRTLPIPAFDKKAGDRPPPPLPATLDGWGRVAFLPREAAALPACSASAKGNRFVFQRSGPGAQIDGQDESGTIALYELRISGNEACVSGISALLTPERRARASAPSVAKGAAKGKKPAPASGGPAAFVRVDLAGKHAEGGDRGLPPAAVRRLSCALVPKP